MTEEKKTNSTIIKESAVKRITLRHLSGSKANQVEEFPLNHFKELVIGRDASATIKYDPDRDDLVSRQHARIMQDITDPTQFIITDLNSRNGTYVNKQRIIGTAKIVPGDVIQFGPGGPEFQFDVEPRPDSLARATRLASTNAQAVNSNAVPPTRAGDAGPLASAPSSRTPSRIGKATVVQMMAQIKSTSRKQMVMGSAALMVLIALVAGVSFYQKNQLQRQVTCGIDMTKKAIDVAAASAPLTPATITKSYTNATVFIEVGWKLIYTPKGSQVYHQYVPFKDDKGQTHLLAAYTTMPDGSIEPLLTLEDGKGKNRPIGGMHMGSGFVVTNDGFILTNRHVAAAWFARYSFPPDALPGALVELEPEGMKFKSMLNQAPAWIPAEAKAVGRQPISGKLLEGRNDYLDVTFAKNELRIPAKLVRVSNRHDVSMIKIDVPQSVNKVELYDNYDSIRPGDSITVLGYPAVSPLVVVGTKSHDPFNRQYQFKVVPDPTVSGGLIGKVLRGEQAPAGHDKYDYMSSFGDSYQLTVNSTGPGNSGGPVFDERGRVIGIFYATNKDDQGITITFAVPIRFGIELMGTAPVLK